MRHARLFAGGILGALLAPGPASPAVHLEARITEIGETGARIVARLRNDGRETVYAVTDTMTVDGKRSVYVSQKGETLLLQLVLQKPTIFLYQNLSGAKLVEIAPGETLDQEFNLTFPLAATTPPYEPLDRGKKSITRSAFREIIVEWGVLRASAALESLLASKVEPGWIHGLEEVPPGQCLVELQSVLRSTAKGP